MQLSRQEIRQVRSWQHLSLTILSVIQQYFSDFIHEPSMMDVLKSLPWDPFVYLPQPGDLIPEGRGGWEALAVGCKLYKGSSCKFVLHLVETTESRNGVGCTGNIYCPAGGQGLCGQAFPTCHMCGPHGVVCPGIVHGREGAHMHTGVRGSLARSVWGRLGCRVQVASTCLRCQTHPRARVLAGYALCWQAAHSHESFVWDLWMAKSLVWAAMQIRMPASWNPGQIPLALLVNLQLGFNVVTAHPKCGKNSLSPSSANLTRTPQLMGEQSRLFLESLHECVKRCRWQEITEQRCKGSGRFSAALT